jgi:predicted anti-sigma-YlaC factor YlaD
MNSSAAVTLASCWLASSVPYRVAVSAAPLNRKPVTSSGFLSVPCSFGAIAITAIRAAIPNGTFSRKIQCQDA